MNSDSCARVLQENWNRFNCPDQVVVVYALPDGVLAGFCARHLVDAERHAEVRGWKAVEPAQAAAA